MKLFKAISEAYLEADDYLAGWGKVARSLYEKAKWSKRREYNDCAYFVLLFARLENRVSRRCDKLIAHKRAAAQWKARRLWDSVDPDRVSFLQKVSLLCEKGHGVYNKIKGYYEIRCEIAHGGSLTVGPIGLSLIAPDLLAIARALR